MDAIRVDKYTLLKLEDGGEYGFKLMEGWENQAGEYKPNFCRRSFKKGGDEKTAPVSVKIGPDKSTAVSVLLLILKELTGDEYSKNVPVDSIPF